MQREIVYGQGLAQGFGRGRHRRPPFVQFRARLLSPGTTRKRRPSGGRNDNAVIARSATTKQSRPAPILPKIEAGRTYDLSERGRSAVKLKDEKLFRQQCYVD